MYTSRPHIERNTQQGDGQEDAQQTEPAQTGWTLSRKEQFISKSEGGDCAKASAYLIKLKTMRAYSYSSALMPGLELPKVLGLGVWLAKNVTTII